MPILFEGKLALFIHFQKLRVVHECVCECVCVFVCLCVYSQSEHVQVQARYARRHAAAR
jgi:hypothetical protein